LSHDPMTLKQSQSIGNYYFSNIRKSEFSTSNGVTFAKARHRMDDQNLLSRAPPCFRWHVNPLIPTAFAVVCTYSSFKEGWRQAGADRKNNCPIFITWLKRVVLTPLSGIRVGKRRKSEFCLLFYQAVSKKVSRQYLFVIPFVKECFVDCRHKTIGWKRDQCLNAIRHMTTLIKANTLRKDKNS
jgi:hypothetical protein